MECARTLFRLQAADADNFNALRAVLPPYMLIVSVTGLPRRSDEKIAYEEVALRKVCDEANVELLETIPNIPGAEKMLEAEMLRPFSILKKYNFKGQILNLTFKCPLNKVDELIGIASKTACSSGYNCKEVGVYVLPLERGRALHCEIDFHATPESAADLEGCLAQGCRRTDEQWCLF